jgi:hypothetical protein
MRMPEAFLSGVIVFALAIRNNHQRRSDNHSHRGERSEFMVRPPDLRVLQGVTRRGASDNCATFFISLRQTEAGLSQARRVDGEPVRNIFRLGPGATSSRHARFVFRKRFSTAF